MAIPMETAEQPTLSDFVGLTDEPGVVGRSAVRCRNAGFSLLVAAEPGWCYLPPLRGVAILLFSVLMRSMGKR